MSLSPDEKLEKNAEIIRKLVEHENIVQHNRITWFFTSQTLLFASLAFAWDKIAVLASVICTVGVISAFTAFVALRLCDKAYDSLSSWWRQNLSGYSGPPRCGYEGTFWEIFAMPSRILPWVFMLSWLVLFFYRVQCYVPPLPKP